MIVQAPPSVLHPRLTPKAMALLDAPDEMRKAHIGSDIWLGYSAAQSLLKDWSDLIFGNPRIHATHRILIADSNMGKTSLLVRFVKMQQPAPNADAETDYRPLISVEMTEICSVDHLFGLILVELGCPWDCMPTRTGDRLLVATALARRQRCVGVLLDNLHYVLVGAGRSQKKVITSVRGFANRVGFHYICTGTKEAQNVVSLDDQDVSRFHRQRLPRWTRGPELDKLLRSLERTLPLRKPSNLASPDLRDFILDRGEGVLGEMTELVKVTGKRAIDGGSEHISLELLREVIAEQLWIPPGSRRDG
jgi:hypothetical protein